MRRWKGRYINPLMWEDEWFMSLAMPEQHLWNYLLTNPRTVETRVGVYELNLQTAAHHTKSDLKEIKRIFADVFTPSQKAFYEVGWVVIPKWIKHQSTNNNSNMWTSAAGEFQQIPSWLNEAVLDPQSPMYMDVIEMSDGILSLECEIGDNGRVNNHRLPFGKVVNGSLKEAKVIEGKKKLIEANAVDERQPVEKKADLKDLREERRKLYGPKGMR